MPIDSHSHSNRVSAAARRSLPSSLLVAALLSACSDGSGKSTPSEPPLIEISNANNYRATSQLSIPSVETATGVDLDICWGDIENDLQCHEVTEEQPILAVTLLRLLNVDQSEAEEKLASGELDMADVNGYLRYNVDEGETCTNLTEFSLDGSEVDVFEQYTQAEEHTYLLLFSDSLSTGRGTRTMMFLDPKDDATNTQVDAPSGCGDPPLLEFDVDIAGTDRVPVPMTGPWIVDWHDLTEDSAGHPVPYVQIDRILLAFYEGMTVKDLEEQIFDVEFIYTRLWEFEHDGGKDADLSMAVDRDSGEPFAGFETEKEGTWLFALLCGGCQNPAPVLLTVLDPGGT